MQKKLYRSSKDYILTGLCGGIGEYFDIDSNLVRVLFVIFGIFGAGLIVYIILSLIIPKDINVAYTYEKKATDEKIKKEVFDKDRNDGRVIFSIVLVLAGVLLLINNFFYYFNFSKLWPLILVVIGFYLILRDN